MPNTIKVKRGSADLVSTYVAEDGELVYDQDNNELRIGDGVTQGGLLLSGGSLNDGGGDTGDDTGGDTGGDTGDDTGTGGTAGGDPITVAEVITERDFTSAKGMFFSLEINPSALGTLQDHGEWIRVEDNGTTKIFPINSIFHGVDYESLDTNNLIQGRDFTLGGYDYKVRAFGGANSDPQVAGADGLDTGYNIDSVKDSEWNRLMYPIHSGSHEFYQNNDTDSYSFNTLNNYTDEELGILDGTDGGTVICMEQSSNGLGSCVTRGDAGISSANFADITSTDRLLGYRPVIELVGGSGYTNTAPTPPTPTEGDTTLGYYGLMRGVDFITPQAFRDLVGYTKPVANYTYSSHFDSADYEFNDFGWIHMVDQGVEKIIPEHPLADTMTPRELMDLNLFYGNRTVEINGGTYIVRVLSSSENDPLIPGLDGKSKGEDIDAVQDSEYNRLVLSLLNDVWGIGGKSITRSTRVLTKNTEYETEGYWFYESPLCMEMTDGGYISRFRDEVGKVGIDETLYVRGLYDDMTYHLYNAWLPVLERIA